MPGLVLGVAEIAGSSGLEIRVPFTGVNVTVAVFTTGVLLGRLVELGKASSVCWLRTAAVASRFPLATEVGLAAADCKNAGKHALNDDPITMMMINIFFIARLLYYKD
jgi:hypothetical protein